MTRLGERRKTESDLLDELCTAAGLDFARIADHPTVTNRFRITRRAGGTTIVPGSKYDHVGMTMRINLDDPDHDARLRDVVSRFWTVPLASAFRHMGLAGHRERAEKDGLPAGDPPWSILIPSVTRAVALADGVPMDRLAEHSVDTDGRMHFRSGKAPTLRGLIQLSTFAGRELGPDFLMPVGLHHEFDHELPWLSWNEIRLNDVLPDLVTQTLTGRRVHEIVAVPGLEPGTPGGDALVLGARSTTTTTRIWHDAGWEQVVPSPEGYDDGWVRLVRRGLHTKAEDVAELNG